jgi:hypothetical protein
MGGQDLRLALAGAVCRGRGGEPVARQDPPVAHSPARRRLEASIVARTLEEPPITAGEVASAAKLRALLFQAVHTLTGQGHELAELRRGVEGSMTKSPPSSRGRCATSPTPCRRPHRPGRCVPRRIRANTRNAGERARRARVFHQMLPRAASPDRLLYNRFILLGLLRFPGATAFNWR